LQEGLGPTGHAFALLAEMADLEIEPFRRNLAITEAKLREEPGDAHLRQVGSELRKEVNARELELFRRKADRFPADLTYRLELGLRLLRAGQYDEATRELQAARAGPGLGWQALVYLGHCFKARNDARLARRHFEEALPLVPAGEVAQRKDLLFELALAHAEAGELARAIEYGHELGNLDVSYRDIHHLMEGWQARLGQDVAP
jgi:tetratricopeptide (TPR) repeat protein